MAKEVVIRIKTEAELAQLLAWTTAAKEAVDLGVKLGNIPPPGGNNISEWKAQVQTLKEAVESIKALTANASGQIALVTGEAVQSIKKAKAPKAEEESDVPEVAPKSKPKCPPDHFWDALQQKCVPITITDASVTKDVPTAEETPPPGFHYDPSKKAFVRDTNEAESGQAGLATPPHEELHGKKQEKPTYDEPREIYTPETQGEEDAIERTIAALTKKRAVLESLADAQQRTNDPAELEAQQKQEDALKEVDDRIEALTKTTEEYYAKKAQGQDIDEKDVENMERVSAGLEKRIAKQRELVDAQSDTKDPRKLVEQDRQVKELGRLEDSYTAITSRVAKFKEQHNEAPSGNIFDGLIGKVHELQTAYHEAGGGITGFLTLLRNAITSPLGLFTAGIAAMAEVATHAVHAFMPLQDAVTDLNSALAAGGKYNENYSASLQAMADSLENATTIGKEQWLSVLAQLTKFGADNSNIESYTRAVQNLAGLMGGDVVSAGHIFARVIEGNYYGLTRYGIEVDHSKTQTEQLAEVMRQLEAKGAGILENRAKTLSGEFRALRNSFHDVWDGIGNLISRTGVLQNVLETASGAVREFTNFFPQTVDEVGNLTNALNKSSSTVSTYVAARMGDMKAAAGDAKTAFSELETEADRKLTEIGKQAKILAQEFATEKEKVDEVTAALKKQTNALYDIAKAQLELKLVEPTADRVKVEEQLAELERHRAEDLRVADKDALDRRQAAVNQELDKSQKEVDNADLRQRTAKLKVSESASQLGIKPGEDLTTKNENGEVVHYEGEHGASQLVQRLQQTIKDAANRIEDLDAGRVKRDFDRHVDPEKDKQESDELGAYILKTKDNVIKISKYIDALAELDGDRGANQGLITAKGAYNTASEKVRPEQDAINQERTRLISEESIAANNKAKSDLALAREEAEIKSKEREQLRNIAIKRLDTDEALHPDNRTGKQFQEIFELKSELQRAMAQEKINLSKTPEERAVAQAEFKALLEQQKRDFLQGLEKTQSALLDKVLKGQYGGRSFDQLNSEERQRVASEALRISRQSQSLNPRQVLEPGQQYGPAELRPVAPVPQQFTRPPRAEQPALLPQRYAQDEARVQAQIHVDEERLKKLNEEFISANASKNSKDKAISEQATILAERLNKSISETSSELESLKKQLESLKAGMVETKDGFKSLGTVERESAAHPDNLNQRVPPISTEPDPRSLLRRRNQLTGDIANYERWRDRAEDDHRVKDWDKWSIAIDKAKKHLEEVNAQLSTIAQKRPTSTQPVEGPLGEKGAVNIPIHSVGEGQKPKGGVKDVIETLISHNDESEIIGLLKDIHLDLNKKDLETLHNFGAPTTIIDAIKKQLQEQSKPVEKPSDKGQPTAAPPFSKIELPPLPEIRVDNSKVVNQIRGLGDDVNTGYAAIADQIQSIRSELRDSVGRLQSQIANRRV